jgi:RHS repeat-associated protein
MNRKPYYLLLLSAILLLAHQAVFGQTPGGYVQADLIKVQGVTSDASMQIDNLPLGQKQTTMQYYDGLGRTVQTVAEQASPLQHDMVQPVAYDNLGRQTASYLPYADENTSNGTGTYRPNALTTDQPAFWNNTGQYLLAKDGSPYSQAVFENSPLQRMLTAGMTGAGYQPAGSPLSGGSGTQHYKTVNYRSNTSGDGSIIIWNPDGSFTSGNYYAANKLSVTDGIDELGAETLIFSDLAGHTILKRQKMGANNVDTYYIYNYAGMVSYVLPPAVTTLMASSGNYSLTQTGIDSLIFQFNYDNMGRLTQKTVPAKGTMSIVYDPLNRPVLMQDANMYALNEWNYIRYDAKGRAISQGIYTDATPARQGQANMQAYVNGLASSYQTLWYETRNTAAATGYYTANIFPTSATGTLTPLAYAYFDNYTPIAGQSYSYVTQGLGTNEETATTAPVKGMPTIVCKGIVGLLSGTWLTSVIFYDKRLNPIQTQSNNQLYTPATPYGVTDFSTIAPDFMGVPQVTQVSKQTASGTTTTVQTTLTYDAMDRLLTVSQQYNHSGSSQLVASYSYNEIGQVIKKSLGYVSPGSWLQNVDMRFNIRGQLTNINNSTLLNDGGITNSDNNDVFGMTFLYDQPGANSQGNSPVYNGNISGVRWMSLNGNTPATATNERAFNYTYDQLDRYTASAYNERASGATSFGTNANAYSETITYNTDNSGNIQNLTRGPASAYVDNLTYAYSANSPNQLHTVTDAGNITQGFYNLTGSSNPYVYDANGNLASDSYKGLGFKYNVLNRVQQMNLTYNATGRSIFYSYSGDGALVRKSVYDNSALVTTTDYIDGFVYITTGTGSPVLSYFPMPEGRVRNTGGTLVQEFIISDQQGNARVSFINNPASPGNAIVQQENSYYGTGLTIQPTVAGDNNKKLYNGGAEWQNDFANLPDYYQTFYRNYDPATARFIGVDPMAESAESMTSYQYAGNNPIMNNDPAGNINTRAPQGPPEPSVNLSELDNIDDISGGGYDVNNADPDDNIGRNTDSNWQNDGAFDDEGKGTQVEGESNYDYNNNRLSFSSDGGAGGRAFWAFAEGSGGALDPTTNSGLSSLGVKVTSSGVYFASIDVTNSTQSKNEYDGAGTLTWYFAGLGGNANQEGPGPSKWQQFLTGVANDLTVIGMTSEWFVGANHPHTYVNDRVANTLRNSPGVDYLRRQYYQNGLTHYDYTFGTQGVKDAGLDPILQFIGSYSVDVTAVGNNLQFTISNQTSIWSAFYHLTPQSWNTTSGPMSNSWQFYIFTEPLRK